MRKTWLVVSVALLSLLISLAAGCGKKAEAPASKTMTVTDAIGRTVEIPQPLERAVWLEKGEVPYALGVKDKLCGLGRSAGGKFHADYMEPLLRDIPDAGLFGEPNAERILELNPQLVICADMFRRANEKRFADLEDKLNASGIRVIYLDVRSFSDPSRYVDSVRTLGKIFGVEKRAQELIDFQPNYLSLFEERLKNLRPEEKVRVYFERGGNYRTFGPAYHENMWIVRAGGLNVFDDQTQERPFIVSPEAIIARNPQVIVKMCAKGEGPIGYGVHDTAPIEKLRKELTSRPGWDNIDAVKNNRLYLLSLEAHHLDQVSAYGCFAKIFYPDRFRDIDPLRKWFEKFLGLKHEGILIYPEPR